MRLKLTLAFLCLMLFGLVAEAQTVTGTVKDRDGEALIGVNVLVVGSSSGTITDFDGKYSLDGLGSDAILEFSYTGYESQRITVGNQSVIDVTMLDNAVLLGEVIVSANQEISLEALANLSQAGHKALEILFTKTDGKLEKLEFKIFK